jgi:PAS domain S-box-containing protein
MNRNTPWPADEGEMAGRVRDHDWAATPLGPAHAWPQALRTAVDICLDSGFASYVWWGPELIQIYNDAAIAVLRAKHPAALGVPAREAWAEVWHTVGPRFEQVLLTGEPVVGEDVPMVPERGGPPQVALFTFCYSALRDAEGRVAGVNAIAIETTETIARLRSEGVAYDQLVRDQRQTLERLREANAEMARTAAALRESEEQYRLIVESARDYAIFTVGTDAKVASWSPGAQAVYGWSAAEVVGKDFAVLFVPEDREAGAPQWELATAREHGAAPDVRWHLRGDGTRVFVDGTTRALSRADGSLAGFLKIGQDVTVRRGVEEALRDSEQRYRLIVEGARDYAILTMDPAGRIESWSPGAEAVYGWSGDEAVGRDVAMTFTPEDREIGAPVEERAVAERDGWSPDVRWHQRGDGARVFIEGTTRALRDTDGTLRGFLKIGQDVTERRRVDQALRELNETLEQRVEARTAELARANASLGEVQAELMSTNEMLTLEIDERERADQARRELLLRLVSAEEQERARLSRELHDSVGQVATGLLLGLRALERGPAGPPAGLADLERLAEQIAREIHHVAAALRPPALDRLGLARALEAHLDEWSRRYGIACDFQAVGIDSTRFEPEVETTLFRAVQEGLTNVARHAGAQSVNLVLEHRPGTVGVILEDDGRGFDVEAAIEAAARARRIGLLGMRERVGLLGGTLQVESAPGAGTTLYVRLPDGSGDEGAAAAEAGG